MDYLSVLLLQLEDLDLPGVPQGSPDEAAFLLRGRLLLIDPQRVGVDHPLDRLHPGQSHRAWESWVTLEYWRYEARCGKAVVGRGWGFWRWAWLLWDIDILKERMVSQIKEKYVIIFK